MKVARQELVINDMHFEEVGSFKYLRFLITFKNEIKEEITARVELVIDVITA